MPRERRAQAYAINRNASNTGFGLGPAVGGFLAATSYSLAFYGASAGFLVYALLVTFFMAETLRHGVPRVGRFRSPNGRNPGSSGFGAVVRDRRYMAFAALLCIGLVAPSMVWVLLAVYTKSNFGLPEYLFGWIPTANSAGDPPRTPSSASRSRSRSPG